MSTPPFGFLLSPACRNFQGNKHGPAQVILAPLARGKYLPFQEWCHCCNHHCDVLTGKWLERTEEAKQVKPIRLICQEIAAALWRPVMWCLHVWAGRSASRICPYTKALVTAVSLHNLPAGLACCGPIPLHAEGPSMPPTLRIGSVRNLPLCFWKQVQFFTSWSCCSVVSKIALVVVVGSQ